MYVYVEIRREREGEGGREAAARLPGIFRWWCIVKEDRKKMKHKKETHKQKRSKVWNRLNIFMYLLLFVVVVVLVRGVW